MRLERAVLLALQRHLACAARCGGGAASASAAHAAAAAPPPPAFPLWRHPSALRGLAAGWARALASAPAPELPPYEALAAAAAAAAARRGARPPPDAVPLPAEEARLAAVLRGFRRSAAARQQALALYMPECEFSSAAREFGGLLRRAWAAPGLRAWLARGAGRAPGPAADAALMARFAAWAVEHRGGAIRAYRDAVRAADLRAPHLWFPAARALRRRVVYHSGPTNSGKTHAALEALAAAPRGAYASPLRLLAAEAYERLNAGGTPCDLVTGQERRRVPGAEHAACTVEMADLARRVDVAVLDEVQMVGDAHRGWAWTRALLGLPAGELHLCGDASAEKLVRALCERAEEELEVVRYERFSPLAAGRRALPRGAASLRRGDCVVAFSRRDIFAIKAAVEAATPHRCAVVYGALPPEARLQQARLFNDAASDYTVMVATDAVGMGLNLQIGRVVFHSLHKYGAAAGGGGGGGDGGEAEAEGAAKGGAKQRARARDGKKRLEPVSVSAIKQIAGRAGRRASRFSRAGGVALAAHARDVPRLAAALAAAPDELRTPRAGLYPEFELLEAFAARRPEGEPFADVLRAFAAAAVVEGDVFFFCRQDALLEAAAALKAVPLALADRYGFCSAPSTRATAPALLYWARRYAAGTASVLPARPPPPHVGPPRSERELRCVEDAHAAASLYLWLSHRFEEELFPGRDDAQRVADALCELMAAGLRGLTEAAKAAQGAGAPPAEGPEPVRPQFAALLECFAAERAELDALAGAGKGAGGKAGERRARARGERRGERRRDKAAAAAAAAEAAAPGGGAAVAAAAFA